MESANLHHQQHPQQQRQDQLVASSSSSSTSTPSYFGAATTHAWTPTPNLTLNGGNYNPNYDGAPNSSMIQESAGLHWMTNNNIAAAAAGENFNTAHEIHLSKIKEELSISDHHHHHSLPKFTDMLNGNVIQDSHDLSDKLLLKTISSGFPINHHFSLYPDVINHNTFAMGAPPPSRGNFSQIYPSINISNLNNSSSSCSSPISNTNFDMNLQALDLLTSARFSGNYSQQPSIPHDHHHLGLYKESLPNKISEQQQQHFTNETTEAKRPNSGNLMEPKTTQSAPKKSRLESRASCPPFKVRKEKLGDRIAALQQLVAPFGKTDTASVLMEAIGYIKFLQNQVETLSVPYMKSSRNKISRTTQGGSNGEDGNEEGKRDLRSRGLCLVPLTCMSYVTNDGGGGGGGGIWPLPNFGGGT